MKIRIILFSVAVLMVVMLTSTVAQSAPEQWGEVIAPGIEYREYDLPDPNNVFVARMERSSPDVILESSIAQGQLVSGRETVSSMAARYDDAINFWGQSYITRTWGLRNDVVVAINGFYFDWYSGVPQSGQIHSGWYAKRYDTCGGGEAGSLVWKLNRDVFIAGSYLKHVNSSSVIKQFVYFVYFNNIQLFDGINQDPDNNQLIIYTPQYDSHTPITDDSTVEVLVEMTRPNLILPTPNYAAGYIRGIYQEHGNTMIPFDHIVLSANGSAAEKLLNFAKLDTEIRVSQEVTEYADPDCSVSLPTDFTKSYSAIGGEYIFIKNGEIQPIDADNAVVRNPRTAIAYNDDYIYFIVVDGRDVRASRGMTIQELAEFTLDESIQATWGIAQDGGGSSTMVVNGEVMNNTFCNEGLCKYFAYLPVIPANGSGETPIHRTYQRWVANGMMMVVVKPPIYSEIFSPGDAVMANKSTALRLGPGSNYESIAAIEDGTSGKVLDHMNGLNGIWAKGVYWWKVSFSNAVGWVPQNNIAGENSSLEEFDLSPR